MWAWVLGLIVTGVVGWGAYRSIRPSRRKAWLSPDTIRTRVEGGMVTGRDWQSGPH
ncbi:hypothetical protein ACVW2K_003557 [Nocardioides sp. HB32]|jgi:hypothetical protein